jgi:hypothetical protein
VFPLVDMSVAQKRRRVFMRPPQLKTTTVRRPREREP